MRGRRRSRAPLHAAGAGACGGPRGGREDCPGDGRGAARRSGEKRKAHRRGRPLRARAVVRRAIEAKMRVVRDDERELGRRALLNLGHTVGHALEAHGQYRELLHGEAVALGTLAELGAGVRFGLTPAPLVERVRGLFTALGVPSKVTRAEIAAAWGFVASDKKRARARIRLPVVTGPGEARLESVELESLRRGFWPGAHDQARLRSAANFGGPALHRYACYRARRSRSSLAPGGGTMNRFCGHTLSAAVLAVAAGAAIPACAHDDASIFVHGVLFPRTPTETPAPTRLTRRLR